MKDGHEETGGTAAGSRTPARWPAAARRSWIQRPLRNTDMRSRLPWYGVGPPDQAVHPPPSARVRRAPAPAPRACRTRPGWRRPDRRRPGVANTCRPSARRRNATAGQARAMRAATSGHPPPLGRFGAQKLVAGRRVEKQPAHDDGGARRVPAGSSVRAGRPPGVADPPAAPAVRVLISTSATEAMLGSASPRKPSVCTRNRSSAERILLVACRAKASGT